MQTTAVNGTPPSQAYTPYTTCVSPLKFLPIYTTDAAAQNLWGSSAATSGSQCTGVDSLSGSTLKWHTKWSWAGGSYNVKSYANVVTKISQKALSAIKGLPSTWYARFSSLSVSFRVLFERHIFLASAHDAPQVSPLTLCKVVHVHRHRARRKCCV